jgi:hypothetical protein
LFSSALRDKYGNSALKWAATPSMRTYLKFIVSLHGTSK